MLREFNLSSITDLDGGRVAEAFDQAVKRAVKDCEDRPGETKPRTVVLQLDLVPVMDESGDVGSVAGAFQVKDTCPTRKSRVYDFSPRRGMLVFNDLSEDNVDQRTLDEGKGFE